MKAILLSFLFLTSACAIVPFQENTNGLGYTIVPDGPANFAVKLQLPADFSEASMERYGARAVGEECLKRGYKYFSASNVLNKTAEGFCYKEEGMKALGLSFSKKESPANVVENLNQKSKTFLQVGDLLLKVDGQELTPDVQLKKITFKAGEKNKNTIKIELLRQGKKMQVDEPMAVLTGATYRPEDLEFLRKKYY
jgi:hypothetical protein